MRILLVAVAIAGMAIDTANAQSLFTPLGDNAVEGSAGWSSGPFSNGLETSGAVSLGGRWDVGFGFNRYSVDLGGNVNSVFTEWTPLVRYFLFKERDDDTPVSFVAHAQYFREDFEGDDTGWYVLLGGQVIKTFRVSETFALHPYAGFSFAGESYTFGGDSESAVYLTRQFGVHAQFTLGPAAWLRITAEEHAFRRETYRSVRLAYGRRF